jgi:hypothetical protein
MPNGGNLHIPKVLNNYAIEYMNENYIFKNFPKLMVNKESDLYYTFIRDFRIPETKRGNGSEANVKTWGVSTSSYNLLERALKDFVTDRDKENSDSIKLERTTVEDLTDDLMRTLEYEASRVLFTTGTWGNNATLNTASSWNYNTTTSAPIQNVLSGTTVIIRSAGTRPNNLFIGNDTFDALKENLNIHERIKYVQKSIVTEDLLASLFDVDKVTVGYSIRDTAQEGQAEDISSIWGGHALLCYLKPNPSMKDVSAFKQIVHSKFPMKVVKWREESRSADAIQVGTMQVTKATATQSAYYFSSVTAI